jgi:putative ATP-binding cassette transporter
VCYDRVTLLSPSDGRILIRELSGLVTPGTRLLIRGDNEEAKGALFRATAGTWSTGTGHLLRPDDDRMLFVAEKPYLPPGTLRDVLTSVKHESVLPDDRILAVLRQLDLEPVLARAGGLDVERRWDTLLSLGEQQQVAAAHVLLTAPRIVFLERPGSSMGAEKWGRIRSLLAAGSTALLTIGIADEPTEAYDSFLDLKADGEWEWTPEA